MQSYVSNGLRALRRGVVAGAVALAMAAPAGARLPRPDAGRYMLNSTGECRVFHPAYPDSGWESGWQAFCRGHYKGRVYDLAAGDGLITSFSYAGPEGVKHFSVVKTPGAAGEVAPGSAEAGEAKEFMDSIIQPQYHVKPPEKPKLRHGKSRTIVA